MSEAVSPRKTTTRATRPTRPRHRLPLVLLLCVTAAPAFAGVPDATIRRIVDLKIELEENNYLSQYRQIDVETRSRRYAAIQAELSSLYREIGQLPRDAQNAATSEIDGLTKARVATLAPQWKAHGEKFKQQREEHDRSLRDALTADVRVAVESQRRRLLLQQRRDRGEITPAAFAAEDKKALDEVMALRAKYAREGGSYVQRFDHELELMTQGIASNPAMPLPESKVPPGQGGTTQADYQHDVGVAADINRQRNELSDRFWRKKDIDSAAFREADHILGTDMARLLKKWQAAGRGQDFERDYRLGRASAPAAPPSQPEIAARLRQPPQPVSDGKTTNPNQGAILVLLAIPVGLLYLLYRLFRRQRAGKRPVSTVYGTAHYAPLEADIRDESVLSKGIFLGKSSGPENARAPLNAPGAPVCSTPEHHTLIVARTRTGKGTRVIVPTLLRYGGSALVIDPKGENAAITAATRRDQLGQSIYILNPWRELAGTYQRGGFAAATYNPLDILDRNDPNAVAIAQTLAGAICPAPSHAKDRYWQGSAASILTAVFLWLADRPDEKKTLARAREIVSLTRGDFTKKYLIPMAASEAFSGAIREMAAPFIDLAQETYSGVMSNLSENTKFLSDPQIKAATAHSSFAMDDLASGKTTVYVVIPSERMDTQKTWLRLVIAAAMHIFKSPREQLGAGHRCLFLIDEFAALGRLDDLPRDIATMSGFGVDFALVVQGLDQLKDHYGEARSTILSNCAYKWFCNVNDLDSAKYLSDTLGKTTVKTQTTSDSASSGGHGGSSSHTTSHGETGRLLLNPDEVLNLGRDVAIAIQPDGHPHYLKPIDYWNLTEGFSALRERHPGLYWKPPLAFDENPYFAKARTAGNGKQREAEAKARRVLEVGPDAGPEEIMAAYKRLMKHVHPDLGGSTYFTQELNEAKAVLLGE